MKCPYCFNDSSEVKDSRSTEDGNAIRRRRLCNNCGGSFTTFERMVMREILVIKADGSKENFDRDKIVTSIALAGRKRAIIADKIEEITSAIQRQIEAYGENEILSTEIGNKVMNALAQLDKIAYIRYASVYRNFTEAKDFEEFIKESDSTDST